MQTPYFFGYGSLVNLDTHSYPDAQPACLDGWRRVWRHTDRQPRPFLTIERDPATSISGMIARVPNGDWQALDCREAGYDRVAVTRSVTHEVAEPVDIAAYSIPDGKHHRPTQDLPIILSYVDVVIQGYLRHFGEKGAAEFFATTTGWDVPILNDRQSPHYPRYCPVSRQAKSIVDAHIDDIGAILRTV